MSLPRDDIDLARLDLQGSCRPDVRALTVFVALAEHGSLQHVAQRLFLDPSLAGKLLRQLEAACGQQLLDRTSRPATLTAAGSLLLPQARRTVAALTNWDQLLRRTRQQGAVAPDRQATTDMPA